MGADGRTWKHVELCINTKQVAWVCGWQCKEATKEGYPERDGPERWEEGIWEGWVTRLPWCGAALLLVMGSDGGGELSRCAPSPALLK